MRDQRPARDRRLQRHDDDDVEEIGRVGDPSEVEADGADQPSLEQRIGGEEEADRGHAEQRRGKRKDLAGDRASADGARRDQELERRRQKREKPQSGQTSHRARQSFDRRSAALLERQIEQIAPDDRIDPEDRHPSNVEVPVVRRGDDPERRHREDDQDCEGHLHPSVAAAERPPDKEETGRKKQVEPFLDAEAPGDRVEVGRNGGAKEVLDVKEIGEEVRRQEIAGHRCDDRERHDIGRDRAQPPPGKEDAEIAPGLADHPADDLRRKDKPAQYEEDFDAGDRDRVRHRLERRVRRQVVGNCNREGRRPAQEIERRAALHCGFA